MLSVLRKILKVEPTQFLPKTYFSEKLPPRMATREAVSTEMSVAWMEAFLHGIRQDDRNPGGSRWEQHACQVAVQSLLKSSPFPVFTILTV
jgi:hypothetical protein